jgi:hypothetical protein
MLNCFLTGTVTRGFLIQVFFMNHIPQAPENNTRFISNFFGQFSEILQSQGTPQVSATPAANLALMVYSGAWGKLIHVKKTEISWHCPFKKCITHLLMLDLILQNNLYWLQRIVNNLYVNRGARRRTPNQIPTHKPENLEFSKLFTLVFLAGFPHTFSYWG